MLFTKDSPKIPTSTATGPRAAATRPSTDHGPSTDQCVHPGLAVISHASSRPSSPLLVYKPLGGSPQTIEATPGHLLTQRSSCTCPALGTCCWLSLTWGNSQRYSAHQRNTRLRAPCFLLQTLKVNHGHLILIHKCLKPKLQARG